MRRKGEAVHLAARTSGRPQLRLSRLTVFNEQCSLARINTSRKNSKPSAASLIPNFDFVAIRVGDVGVGVAWAEFASPEQLAAGVLDFVDGRVNVAGRDKTEAEVRDATALTRTRRLLVKRDHILPPRRPSAHQSLGPP